MQKKSSSKASSKPKANESAEHYHNDLIKRIAELEAEVASLKKQCTSQTPGGADPRLDILLKHLLERQFLSEKYCKRSGLL